MSPQSAPTAATASPRAHRTRTLVLVAVAASLVTGLIGFGLGGLGGVLLTSGLGGSGSRTDQNVSDGCAILDRVESELPVTDDSLSLEDPLLFELGAAGQLFMASATTEDGDEAVQDAGRGLLSGASMLDTGQINESLEALAPLCADA